MNMSHMNSNDYKRGNWIVSLEQVESWINNFPENLEDLPIIFCSLKRHLLEKTDDVDIRERGFELTDNFLDILTNWLYTQQIPKEFLVTTFGILMTILGEFGPYRYETKRDPAVKENIIIPFETIRKTALETTKTFFSRTEFMVVEKEVRGELFPLLDSITEKFQNTNDRFLPFRIIQIGKVAEKVNAMKQWLLEDGIDSDEKSNLVDIFSGCYDLKYPRFGTSGLRGIWQDDFTEEKARRTAYAISLYLGNIQIPSYVTPTAHDFTGRWVVVGYDGRRNSRRVAEYLAETVIQNGFPVKFSSKPTPTPALAFYETHVLPKDGVAGLLNCTASHNPSEWQGIKFNPKDGYPASTHLTNIIANRINEMQLLNILVEKADLDQAEKDGKYQFFDPMPKYWNWIKENGVGNNRIPIDIKKMAGYFSDKLVIIDEMHGAGKGYMSYILGDIGIRHKVIHAERDIDLGDLDYANPELPFIQPLIDKVAETEAAIGLGMDTDADRFGVVDVYGKYFRPNQILAMLSYYLAKVKQMEGRIVITQTGLPMINFLLNDAENIERPASNVIPAYVDHPFYQRRVGSREDMVWDNVFVVPVGIKYIAEVPRMDVSYNFIKEDLLDENWMDSLLLGGEESSGLTTRGHVPDKDGIWANLLILDMVAHFGKSVNEIWDDITTKPEAWESFGGRIDVDASDSAKEQLINNYLDQYIGKDPGEEMLMGYPVLYAGGIRYDMVEIFLGDDEGKMRHYLRIRASGTEPINRVYTETKDPDLWLELQNHVLKDLDILTGVVIKNVHRLEGLVDVLSLTIPNNVKELVSQVNAKLEQEGWKKGDLIDKLIIKKNHLEKRNQLLVDKWISNLN